MHYKWRVVGRETGVGVGQNSELGAQYFNGPDSSDDSTNTNLQIPTPDSH